MTAIAGFILDATITEDHVMSADATDNPVEKGIAITDHIRRLADTLVMDCIVTDSPMGAMVAVRNASAGPTTRLVAHPGGIVLPEPVTVDPYRSITDEARAYMRLLMDTGEPVVVETAKRTYDNMALTSITERQDASTGTSFRFTATFKQVRIVTNERSTVRVSNPAASKKKKRGHKAGYPTGPIDQSVKAASARIKARKAQRAAGNAPTLNGAENAQLERDLDTVRGGQAAQQRLEEFQAQAAAPINPGGAAGHF